MAKREIEETDETTESAEERRAAAAAAAAEKGRYPGDILRDKKTGKKAKFVNEYGTNGRAIIVIPEGMKRSELWDASAVEIIKKAKRPAQPAPMDLAPKVILDDEDEELGNEEEESEADDS